jgi:predicted XRE-type DNA-binding protein
MKDEAEFVQGSGNVFQDFGYADADMRQAKAIMGAQIIKILDREGPSTRQAEAKTGISHSEFSRIRRASFSRFTIDRLMTISVQVRARAQPEGQAATMRP